MNLSAVDWVSAIVTGIGGIGSATAAFVAAQGLVESKKYRMMATRPIITLDCLASPRGGSLTADQPSQRITGIFHFEVCNSGLGAAVLGSDPFRQTRHPSSTGQLRISQTNHKNVLLPGEKCKVELALGCWGLEPMSNPWLFDVHYEDINGDPYWTTVSINPRSGDVTRLEHGPKEENTWWERFKRAVNEVGA